jgi:hypothetical protein
VITHRHKEHLITGVADVTFDVVTVVTNVTDVMARPNREGADGARIHVVAQVPVAFRIV